MRVVHLTASTFFGGPERQMLGLAEALPSDHPVAFACFREGGRCAEFLAAVRGRGFDGIELAHDTPNLRAAVRELTGVLRERRAGLLLCHGYKANLLGRIAARRAGVPAVAVSRGWTGESRKVRVYEAADRWHLRLMDHVVAVSDGQARKVRNCGVPRDRLSVIRNSARLDAFAAPDPAFRGVLRGHFPAGTAVSHVVVAAGRLSPEKGFGVLADAAAGLLKSVPSAGLVLFGEGPERAAVEEKLRAHGIADRVRLPGFTRDLDKLLPWADALVIPSFTEGLPNVALEASAAGVPVVATAVGGNAEVVADGETGFVVPPGEPAALAARLAELLRNESLRRGMGDAARRRMHARFTFDAQAAAYLKLFARLRSPRAFRPQLEAAL